jgi:hypothetical protein
VQDDAPGDDSAKAEQGSQVNTFKPMTTPGAKPLLVAGHRGDS